MKRLIFLTVAIILPILGGYAQNAKELDIKDYTLELKEDGSLNLDMEIDLSQLNVKTTQVVVFTPAVINGSDTLMLKSVGVYGRNRRIFYMRNQDEKPTGAEDVNLKADETSQTLAYKASVAFQEWMDGCKVELLRTDFGCCGQAAIIDRTGLVERFPLEKYFPEVIYLRPEHEVVKSREINGQAFIDFPVNKTFINPSYRKNTVELAKIIGTIDSVKNDKDITIKSIFIKGYASPESPYSHNANLAKGRTKALKDYVESLYHFGEGFIKTDYEPEDWAGLERYVAASALPNRDKILEAIRSDREPDHKEWVIKSTWKQDYRYLYENCYPALRHSDYTIEYEIRSYTTPQEIEAVLHTAPQNLSLEEFYVLAQTYEPGSDAFNELYETAVRMYPDAPAANLNAANAAILRGDYKNALRYLDRAGDLPEAIYARGVLMVYQEDLNGARPYLEQALKLGITKAREVLEEISVNRNIYRMKHN